MKYRKYLTFNDRADEFTVPLDVSILEQKSFGKKHICIDIVFCCVRFKLFILSFILINLHNS